MAIIWQGGGYYNPAAISLKKLEESKQDTLISGITIKTINGKNMLTSKAVTINTVAVTEANVAPEDEFVQIWVDLSEGGEFKVKK